MNKKNLWIAVFALLLSEHLLPHKRDKSRRKEEQNLSVIGLCKCK